jgi:DNA-binding NtrC family response regulator
LTEKAKEMLLNYSWDGNVRELRNYVEYFVNLGKKVIDVEDIPFYYEKSIDNEIVDAKHSEMLMEFLETAGNDIRKYIFVLEVLEKAYINKTRVGRRTIYQSIKAKGIFISEQEIRRILNDLEKLSIVNITKGRSGTIITDEGRSLLKYLEGEQMG